jgi:hypothetical protein
VLNFKLKQKIMNKIYEPNPTLGQAILERPTKRLIYRTHSKILKEVQKKDAAVAKYTSILTVVI